MLRRNISSKKGRFILKEVLGIAYVFPRWLYAGRNFNSKLAS